MSDKGKKYLTSAFRTMLLLLIFCAVSAIAESNMRGSSFQKQVLGFWNETVYDRTGFFYSLLIYFSLSGVFCIHHIHLKDDFMNGGRDGSRIKFILTSPYFILDIPVIVLFCVLFSVFPPISSLGGGFFGGMPIGRQRLTSSVIMIPIMLLMHFSSYLSTVSWWGGQKKKIGDDEGSSPFFKFLLQLILTSAAWSIAGSALTIAVPMLSTFFAIFGAAGVPILVILAVLAVIWAALTLMRLLSVGAKRRSFIKKLSNICLSRGFELTKTESRDQFLLKTGTKMLSCRFLSAPIKNEPLYLHENGTATRIKERLLFKHHVSEEYFFDAEEGCEKILIVCPCRSDVYIKSDHGEHLLESGDKIMEYRVYNASGFLNAADRGLIK